MTARYERTVLEPGLVEVRGRGGSIPAAFAQAALGVLDLLAGDPVRGEGATREIRAHGRTLDDLLANWIGECLYVHEIEGFVPTRIEFAAFTTDPASGAEALRLHAFAHGAEGDVTPAEPAGGGPVRQASVRESAPGFEAAVVVEIR